MTKIIPFNPKEIAEKQRVETLVSYANQIDAINRDYLDFVDSQELIAVLANRLSELIRIHKSKEKLWKTCRSLIEEHAELKNSSEFP